jgi:hypothetical protein
VLADGSKIGQRRGAHVADLTAVDELITDASADRAVLQALAARGVSLRVAEAAAGAADPEGTRRSGERAGARVSSGLHA